MQEGGYQSLGSIIIITHTLYIALSTVLKVALHMYCTLTSGTHILPRKNRSSAEKTSVGLVAFGRAAKWITVQEQEIVAKVPPPSQRRHLERL